MAAGKISDTGEVELRFVLDVSHKAKPRNKM